MDTEQLNSKLSDIAGQASRVARAEQEINKSAEERLAVVEAKIIELRPKTLNSREAAEQYEDMIAERGHLQHVLGRTRRH